MLTLARVTVADLIPATNLKDEVVESDFLWDARCWDGGGVGSKSSRVQRSARRITGVGGRTFCLRLRSVLSHRPNGLEGLLREEVGEEGSSGRS